MNNSEPDDVDAAAWADLWNMLDGSPGTYSTPVGPWADNLPKDGQEWVDLLTDLQAKAAAIMNPVPDFRIPPWLFEAAPVVPDMPFLIAPVME